MKERTGLRRKVLISVFGSLAAIIGAVAVAPDAMAAPEQSIIVRVGDQPSAQLVYGAFWVAEAKGYFHRNGIKIERHTYANGPQADLDLAKDHIDMAMAALLPHMQAFAGGVPLKLVLSLTKGNTTLVAAKGITDVGQLNGKRVGSPGLGTIHDTALSLMEAEHHIKVTHVPARITDLPVLLEKGDISAFIGWETVAAQAVLTVPGVHYLVRQPIPNNENLELAVSDKFIKAHPQATQHIVDGIVEAMKFISACKPEAKAILANTLNVSEAKEIVDTAWPQIDITQPDLNVSSAVMWIRAAVDGGKLAAPLAKSNPKAFLESASDMSFLKKAEAKKIPVPSCS